MRQLGHVWRRAIGSYSFLHAVRLRCVPTIAQVAIPTHRQCHLSVAFVKLSRFNGNCSQGHPVKAQSRDQKTINGPSRYTSHDVRVRFVGKSVHGTDKELLSVATKTTLPYPPAATTRPSPVAFQCSRMICTDFE
eukprot:COSAG01_NODE_366_length_18064_cov_35.830615_19_plen_135_part_00